MVEGEEEHQRRRGLAWDLGARSWYTTDGTRFTRPRSKSTSFSLTEIPPFHLVPPIIYEQKNGTHVNCGIEPKKEHGGFCQRSGVEASKSYLEIPDDLDSHGSDIRSRGEHSASTSAATSRPNSPETEYTSAESQFSFEESKLPNRRLLNYPMSEFYRKRKNFRWEEVTTTIEGQLLPAWTHVRSRSKKNLNSSLWFVGRGGTSCVFGTTAEVGTGVEITLAVKILDVSQRKDAAQQLEQERKIMQSLRHNHIVALVGTCEEEDLQGFLVYPLALYNLAEYMQAISKTLTLKNESFAQQAKLARAFGCLSSAVYYLHVEKNVKHKDIKPENIFLDDHGSVLLGDFGISKQYTSKFLTVTNGPTAFTTKYAAPEVVAQKDRGLESDIFSLGCVFLEMATLLRGEALEQLTFNVFGNEHAGASVVPTYQGSLTKVQLWVEHLKQLELPSRQTHREWPPQQVGYLDKFIPLLPQAEHLDTILAMMSESPSQRPSIETLREKFADFAKDCTECHGKISLAAQEGLFTLRNMEIPRGLMEAVCPWKPVDNALGIRTPSRHDLKLLDPPTDAQVDSQRPLLPRLQALSNCVGDSPTFDSDEGLEVSSIYSDDASDISEDDFDPPSLSSFSDLLAQYPVMAQKMAMAICQIMDPNPTSSTSDSFTTCPTGSTGESTQTKTGTGSSPAKRRATNKRQRLSRGDGDDHDEDAGDNGSENPHANDHGEPQNASLTPARLFACPYYKRNPSLHRQNAKCVKGWAVLHRLKEHIERKHRIYRCVRCRDLFGDKAARDQHLGAPIVACDRRSAAPDEVRHWHEGFDDDQAVQFKKRGRKRRFEEPSEEEKWKRWYKILFPLDEDSDIPSPYCDGIPFQFTQGLRPFMSENLQRRLPNMNTHQAAEVTRVVMNIFAEFSTLHDQETRQDRPTGDFHEEPRTTQDLELELPPAHSTRFEFRPEVIVTQPVAAGSTHFQYQPGNLFPQANFLRGYQTRDGLNPTLDPTYFTGQPEQESSHSGVFPIDNIPGSSTMGYADFDVSMDQAFLQDQRSQFSEAMELSLMVPTSDQESQERPYPFVSPRELRRNP